MTLSFDPDDSLEGLQIQPSSATAVIEGLLNGLRQRAHFELHPRGILRIESSIPIGAGLGSSAALCVALSRWLAEPLKIPQNEILSFATQFEHHFHGRSSGLDIAVIATGEPVLFAMGKRPQPLGVSNVPCFTFHDTGVRARTHDCVAQVDEQCRNDSEQALKTDAMMSSASLMAMEGLTQYDTGNLGQGLETVKNAMLQAQKCFYLWGLVPPAARDLEADLLKKGALAVKMTGAGGGGMMVALWATAR